MTQLNNFASAVVQHANTINNAANSLAGHLINQAVWDIVENQLQPLISKSRQLHAEGISNREVDILREETARWLRNGNDADWQHIKNRRAAANGPPVLAVRDAVRDVNMEPQLGSLSAPNSAPSIREVTPASASTSSNTDVPKDPVVDGATSDRKGKAPLRETVVAAQGVDLRPCKRTPISDSDSEVAPASIIARATGETPSLATWARKPTLVPPMQKRFKRTESGSSQALTPQRHRDLGPPGMSTSRVVEHASTDASSLSMQGSSSRDSLATSGDRYTEDQMREIKAIQSRCDWSIDEGHVYHRWPDAKKHDYWWSCLELNRPAPAPAAQLVKKTYHSLFPPQRFRLSA